MPVEGTRRFAWKQERLRSNFVAAQPPGAEGHVQRAENPGKVTSKGLCQHERGADALVLVFVMEDGKQDAIHRGSVGEDAHRAGSPSDFSKASLDGVCG